MISNTTKTAPGRMNGYIVSSEEHGDIAVVVAASRLQAAALVIPAILHDRPDLEPVVDELVARGWPQESDLTEFRSDRPGGYVLEGK